MSVVAIIVTATIGMFSDPEDSLEELSELHQACIAVFLHQLLMSSKHKEKIVGILEALIVEFKNQEQTDAQPSKPPKQ